MDLSYIICHTGWGYGGGSQNMTPYERDFFCPIMMHDNNGGGG